MAKEKERNGMHWTRSSNLGLLLIEAKVVMSHISYLVLFRQARSQLRQRPSFCADIPVIVVYIADYSAIATNIWAIMVYHWSESPYTL